MRRPAAWAMAGLLMLAAALAGGDDDPSIRAIADPAERGKLFDAAEMVRGDSGRWQDTERWVHAPAPDKGAKRFAVDDWLDKHSAGKFAPTAADENWLLFSTRQLNDHDRVWIGQVKRNGKRITVEVWQATWRGKYFKNFTYYQILGVNLGRLPPGDYEAVCILRPLSFSKFDGNGQPQEKVQERFQDNWPKDEQPADRQPLELTTKFTVVEAAR